jgi:hypothetical protein
LHELDIVNNTRNAAVSGGALPAGAESEFTEPASRSSRATEIVVAKRASGAGRFTMLNLVV